MMLIRLNQSLKINALEQKFHPDPIRLFHAFGDFSKHSEISMSSDILYNKNYYIFHFSKIV